jgi:uncharacterized protein YbjT (DUF2867 family)
MLQTSTRSTTYNDKYCPNIMSMSTVLVIGATGKQGGATAKALLNRGFHVRALTRNVRSPAATRLSDQGIHVVRGDLSDKASLISALEGVVAAYFMTDSSIGIEGEIAQGTVFIAALQEARVERVVYSSAHSADRTTSIGGVPHWDSKLDIERSLKASGLKWTILRPVSFMENIPLAGITRYMALGTFSAALGGPHVKMQVVSADDIGSIAAKTIAESEIFIGQTIDIVGDDVSVAGMQKAFEGVAGRKVARAPMPRWLIMMMVPYV